MKTDAEKLTAKSYAKDIMVALAKFISEEAVEEAIETGLNLFAIDFHAKMLEEKMPSEREIKEIITKVVDNEKHLTLYGKVTMISEILIQHLKA